mmetsp:Transcript_98583/g.306731  ORF Transcript_98583/g.306731 Transcript_98583/m.306731 type:complete len:212 (+) Transcript_98583:526-1161(+)
MVLRDHCSRGCHPSSLCGQWACWERATPSQCTACGGQVLPCLRGAGLQLLKLQRMSKIWVFLSRTGSGCWKGSHTPTILGTSFARRSDALAASRRSASWVSPRDCGTSCPPKGAMWKRRSWPACERPQQARPWCQWCRGARGRGVQAARPRRSRPRGAGGHAARAAPAAPAAGARCSGRRGKTWERADPGAPGTRRPPRPSGAATSRPLSR